MGESLLAAAIGHQGGADSGMAVIDLCARRVRCHWIAIRVHPLEGNGRTSIGPHGFRSLESVVREVGVADEARNMCIRKDSQDVPDFVRHYRDIAVVRPREQNRAEPWLQIIRAGGSLHEACRRDGIRIGPLVQHQD